MYRKEEEEEERKGIVAKGNQRKKKIPRYSFGSLRGETKNWDSRGESGLEGKGTKRKKKMENGTPHSPLRQERR